LQEAVRAYELESYFEDVRGLPDSLGASKIDLGVSLLKSLSTDGSNVVMIGDSSHDAEVARALKCRCVLVSHGLESSRKLALRGFPVAGSLSEAYEFIRAFGA
jgi:phosphoglycolate phosphatase